MNKLGIISDDFTFENVRKTVGEITSKLAKNRPVIVSYDARFLADKFALEAVKILELAGIGCFLTERDTPTPVVAWAVEDKKAAGGIVGTGAAQPAEYLGINFIPGSVSEIGR